jgi:hypothetical protein
MYRISVIPSRQPMRLFKYLGALSQTNKTCISSQTKTDLLFDFSGDQKESLDFTVWSFRDTAKKCRVKPQKYFKDMDSRTISTRSEWHVNIVWARHTSVNFRAGPMIVLYCTYSSNTR